MNQGAENRSAPHRTGQRFVDVGAETWAAVLEQLKVVVRNAGLAQQGNPREAPEALETVKMEATDNKPNSTAMK